MSTWFIFTDYQVLIYLCSLKLEIISALLIFLIKKEWRNLIFLFPYVKIIFTVCNCICHWIWSEDWLAVWLLDIRSCMSSIFYFNFWNYNISWLLIWYLSWIQFKKFEEFAFVAKKHKYNSFNLLTLNVDFQRLDFQNLLFFSFFCKV